MDELDLARYWDLSETVRNVQKMERHLAAGRLNSDDFAKIMVDDLVCAPDDESCRQGIATIPASQLRAVFEYLKREVESVDFMPSPRLFLMPPYTPDDDMAARRRFRPNYMRVYALLNERLRE